MIRPIVTDPMLLSQKSKPAGKEDLAVATDLMDTVTHHQAHCIGMAANMIGVLKRIIVVRLQDTCLVMVNPVITKQYGGVYETEEGCLSHTGTKATRRFTTIDVTYFDQNFQPQKGTFSDLAAQVIQHEIDHCNGILI